MWSCDIWRLRRCLALLSLRRHLQRPLLIGDRSLAFVPSYQSILAVVFAADCYGIGKIRLGTTADGLEFHGAMDMSVKGILW